MRHLVTPSIAHCPFFAGVRRKFCCSAEEILLLRTLTKIPAY